MVFLYVASLAAMVIANVVYEGGLTQYILVQAVGLIMVSGFALFPWIAAKRVSAQSIEHPVRVGVR